MPVLNSSEQVLIRQVFHLPHNQDYALDINLLFVDDLSVCHWKLLMPYSICDFSNP